MEATMKAVESFHFLWDWELTRMPPVEASVEMFPVEAPVEASFSTSAEDSNELRSFPRASTWYYKIPLTSTPSHEL